VTETKCMVVNEIMDMPNTVGVSIDEASNEVMLRAVPLRLLMRFWFCGVDFARRCNKTDCINHVDSGED